MKTILYFSLLLLAPIPTLAAEDHQKVTFQVGCYDVGAAALEHQPGVIRIEKGWQNAHEVNRVEYDPRQVSRQQLEQQLKQAGTWQSTHEESSGAER